jgi:AraC-like DNA-binding protein
MASQKEDSQVRFSKDSTHQPRVIAAWTGGMLLSAEHAGLDRKALLKSGGLSEAELEDRDAPVDIERHLYMVREIVRLQPGISTGLRTGMAATTARFGVLGNVLRYAKDLRCVFADYIRFQRLVTDVTIWSVTQTPIYELMLSLHPLLHSVPSATEAQMATLVAVGRQLTGAPLVPRAVTFCHEPHGDPAEHRQFFGCPVTFGAEQNCLRLDPKLLDFPIQTAHELAHRHFLHSVEAVLDMKTGLRPTSEAVRQYVVKQLQHGPPRRGDVARFLGKTPRTMLRYLEQEGQTFEKILDSSRRDLALAYAADSRLAVFEIAGLLGFTEPSAFFRAFRRWTGKSPQQHRRQLVAAC